MFDKTRIIVVLYLIGLGLIPGGLIFSWALLSAGVSETVDSDGSVYCCSLAVDSNANPHISYCCSVGLKYAVKKGGKWAIEVVESHANYSSLALDSSNAPHISYVGLDFEGHPVLKYAVKIGDKWTFEIVEPAEAYYYAEFSGETLALDSNGNPHIVYVKKTFHLNYAFKSGGAWNIETVAEGSSPSLALDSNGNPHISYSHNNLLRHAFKSGGEWTTETVDSGKDVGVYNSLALDSVGNIHISYNSYSGLKYALKSEGEWTIETADSDNYGGHNSLALTSNGYPHISYCGDDEALKYAALREYGVYAKAGVKWYIETLDSGSRCTHTALAWLAPDIPHIGYPTNGNLKYFSGNIVSSPGLVFTIVIIFLSVGVVALIAGTALWLKRRRN